MQTALREPETMGPSQSVLTEMVHQLDDKHDEAHARLRKDFQAFEARMLNALETLRNTTERNATRLTKLENTPPNVEKMILTPRVVIAMIVFAVTTTAGVWSANYGIRAETSGLRSDVRDILTRMEAQKTAIDSTAKLQELQSTQLRTAIDDMKRRQELQQYEIQALKEVILTGKGRTK